MCRLASIQFLIYSEILFKLYMSTRLCNSTHLYTRRCLQLSVKWSVFRSLLQALYQHFDIEEDDNNPGGKYPMEIVQHVSKRLTSFLKDNAMLLTEIHFYFQTAINTAAHTVGAIVSHPIHGIGNLYFCCS